MVEKSTTQSPNGDLMRGGVCMHERFKQDGYNFVKIRKDCKGCLEKRWNTRVYKYWDSSLKKHMEEGGGYGIQTNNSIINGKQLLIIDFDNREFQDKITPLLPETFTTTSASSKNCNHYWFLTDKQDKKFNVVDEDNNTLADVLGEHGQVVAPGSKHKSGSTYKVVKDVDLAFISYNKILEIFKDYIPQKEIKVRTQKIYNTNTEGFYGLVKTQINIPDILEENGIDITKNPTQCPFHTSESGECLSFTLELAKCHHCGKGWNLFNIVKDIYDLSTKETFEKLAELTNTEEELKEFQAEWRKSNV